MHRSVSLGCCHVGASARRQKLPGKCVKRWLCSNLIVPGSVMFFAQVSHGSFVAQCCQLVQELQGTWVASVHRKTTDRNTSSQFYINMECLRINLAVHNLYFQATSLEELFTLSSHENRPYERPIQTRLKSTSKR